MQVDLGVALAVGHVGDGVRRRREARREHEVFAAREIAHVGAVLIHECEPLDAAVLRPGLVDEHHAAVEIALLAGEPLVDRVRDDVSDAAPVVRRGVVLLAVAAAGRRTRPRAETAAFSRPSVWVRRPVTSACALICAPVGKARDGVDGGDPLQVGGLIDRREQSGTLQVRRDDLRHVARGGRDRAVATPTKVRQRDRHRLHVALGDVELEHRRRLRARQCRQARRRRAAAQRHQPAAAQHLGSTAVRSWLVVRRRRRRSSADHVARIEGDLDVLP